MDIVEILKLAPNYLIAVLVIILGYKMMTNQMAEMAKSLSRLATLVETLIHGRGGK